MRIIAEAGSCDGRLDTAIHAAVRAAQAGAWAFKVQMFRAETLTLPDAANYDRGLDTPSTQFESFRKAVYPYSEWAKVKSVCDDLDMEFFASCWDPEAIAVCEDLGVNYYKIGSADITHRPLIEDIARTGKQVILSTGASTFNEIHAAVGWIKKVWNTPGKEPILMACSLAYPTDTSEANLLRMLALRTEFPGSEVGYSDHTRIVESVWPVVALGGNYLEKHFTVTPGEPGDHRFAVDSEGLKYMTGAAAVASEMLGDPALKPSEVEQAALVHARRSIVAAVDIPAGTRLTDKMFAYLRPGTGMPPSMAYDLLGLNPSGPFGRRAMKAMVDIPAGTVIDRKWVGFVGASLTVE